MKKFSFQTPVQTQKGALLIELLLVISILAIILSLGAQASLASLTATKVSGDKDVALQLMNETIEAVRSASDEKWQNVYTLTKTSANHHYATSSTGKWTLNNSGDEVVRVNGIPYTRYFYVDNVSRDLSTRAIETSYNSAHDDPSTQQVTVSVLWGNANGNVLSTSQYISRWRNKTCAQSSWAGGKTFPSDPAPSSSCTSPTNTYYNDDGHISNTGGTLKIQ